MGPINIIEQLPVEVLYQIFEKLPVKALPTVSRVCRGFYITCQDERLWRREFIKYCLSRTDKVIAEQRKDGERKDGDVPRQRLCHTAVVSKNNMYIHGGHNTQPNSQLFREVLSDLWRYSFEDKKWERLDENIKLPHKTEHSAVVYDNKIWFFGGYSGQYFTNSLYSYDLDTNVCQELPLLGDVPPERSAHIGAVYKNKMYIFGGWNGITQNNDLYAFNFDTLTWSKVEQKGMLPSPRCSHAAIVSEKHQSMFVFAGYGGKNYLNDLCQFSFETETWTIHRTSLPSPRSRMRLVEFNDKIYIYGGWNKMQHFNNLYQYDIDLKKWQELELHLTPEEGKIGQHSMVIHNNILYIFAGYNSGVKSSTNDLYAYRLSRPVL